MIRFFRINDWSRLVAISLILVTFRLPTFFLEPAIATHYMLEWITVGELLQQGMPFLDLEGAIGPMAAAVYTILISFFGTNPILWQIASLLLIISQAYQFNHLLNRRNIYSEKTYMPALCYVLFMNLTPDFQSLPPVLLSITFLIPVISYSIGKQDNTVAEDNNLLTGSYLGLAFLTYFPTFCFLLMTLIVFTFYRTASLKALLLIGYTFFLTIALCLTYFSFFGQATDFFMHYVLNTFSEIINLHSTWANFSIASLLPLSLLLIGMFKTFVSSRKYNNHQTRAQRIMVLWVIFSAISLLFVDRSSTYQLMVLVPAIAFFTSYFLFSITKDRLAELTLWCLMLLVAFTSIYG